MSKVTCKHKSNWKAFRIALNVNGTTIGYLTYSKGCPFAYGKVGQIFKNENWATARMNDAERYVDANLDYMRKTPSRMVVLSDLKRFAFFQAVDFVVVEMT